MRLIIENAHLIDPANRIDAAVHLLCEAGQVAAIVPAEQGDAFPHITDAQRLQAKGLMLLPGIVDLSVRLREPGHEHRATMASELTAAVAGGVTTVVLPPDTQPSLDEPGIIKDLCQRAQQLGKARLLPLGALSMQLAGEQLSEMGFLSEVGCVAFSQANQPLPDLSVLQRAMAYAHTYGYHLWLQPHIASLSSGVAASGAFASRLGLTGVPVAAETIALHTIFELQKTTPVPIHLCRLSSADGVALVREAKARGLPVTADISVQHLLLIDSDIGYFDTHYRLSPPLRSQRDRQALWDGLLDGTIDAICSDHYPLDDEEKSLPFAQATPGASSVELLLSLVLKWAQEQGVHHSKALACLTQGPATILRQARPDLPAIGQLGVGSPADFSLVDLNASWVVNSKCLQSQSAHTPFYGYPMLGAVRSTFVNGQLVWQAN